MAALRKRIEQLESELGNKLDTLILIVHTDLGESKAEAEKRYSEATKVPLTAFKKVVYLLTNTPRPVKDNLSKTVTENGALKTD